MVVAVSHAAEARKTRVVQVDESKIGTFLFHNPERTFLGGFDVKLSETNQDAVNLQEAASMLQTSDVPVAFPTETVYGLGANATCSSAIRGIYTAKQRPPDNPLIIHISSLFQLRTLFSTTHPTEPIPEVYNPLISRFWPGPLTILIPVPSPSPLAPEVTNHLPTVAVRMPSSRLALALIHLAGFPLAAPSANASSKPSPTTADHVFFDLAGKIDLIIDGGPCDVGVESTVVDGLSKPPVILRPGGISLEMLKECPGWEDVTAVHAVGAVTEPPRAPGMKYKHYSPNARVLIFHGEMNIMSLKVHLKNIRKVGILTTQAWSKVMTEQSHERNRSDNLAHQDSESTQPIFNSLRPLGKADQDSRSSNQIGPIHYCRRCLDQTADQDIAEFWTIHLGPRVEHVAQGLFSALRQLDQQDVNIIFVEGVEENEGGVRAAIMNRLRKAAEAEINF